MPIAADEVSQNAMGGTEQMKYGLADRLDPKLLDEVQIVASRVRELDKDKIRIFWAHDLPGDPESEFLKNKGYDKFHRLVFVSNWQMQAYINYYQLPWSKCVVLQNAIEPIPVHEKPTDKIKLIYFSTPHRGLNILTAVFDEICKKYDNVELDVYSSYKLYGWDSRDKDYEALFERLRSNPKVSYHGAVSNFEIREALTKAHILAYPSIWLETSCLVLLEAMSAGLICVHPNFGALYETAANWTLMYQWNEDMSKHATIFYSVLSTAIDEIQSSLLSGDEQKKQLLADKLSAQKSYVDLFYSWKNRTYEWEALLKSLLDEPRDFPGEFFSYSSGY